MKNLSGRGRELIKGERVEGGAVGARLSWKSFLPWPAEKSGRKKSRGKKMQWGGGGSEGGTIQQQEFHDFLSN